MDQQINPEAVPDPNRALPGPHPHESADFREWRGTDSTGSATTGLPPGVEPYKAPEEGPEKDQELV